MSQLITEQAELEKLCADILAENPKFITIDTEFMREKTYYPILCLIQVASSEHVAAIDPLANIDLNPFFSLLENEHIVKVFHAAYQDVEIFYNLTRKVPSPLFDTQVAAMVCGYGEAISYEALVNSLAKSSIDKGSRFTDWSRRPLTERQLTYALGDVTHLRTIYEKLEDRLGKLGRSSWISGEMEILSSPDTYEIKPSEAWKKIRYRNMRPKGLAYLREVAAIREREAQRLDIPKQRLVKDETLLEIAASTPHTKDQLKRIRGMTEGAAEGRLGNYILAGIERVAQLPESEFPQPHKSKSHASRANPALIDMLKLLLKLVCDENEVAAKLVASTKDIELLATQSDQTLPVLHGWRYDIFGKRALALKEGKIAFAYKKGKIRFIDV